MAETVRAGRPGRPVLVTGMDVLTAFGRGTVPLADAVFTGTDGFRTLDRFDVSARRVARAAQLPGTPDLRTELAAVLAGACEQARLGTADRAGTTLLLATTADRAAARSAGAGRPELTAGALATELAGRTGLGEAPRSYTTACVAASTAVADAAAMISSGRAERVAVAAGYLLEPDRYTLFDSARALAADGRLRPFSTGRKGMLLGDAVAAVVLESAPSAAARQVEPLARLAGWGRSGDAYHVSQPHPEGQGMARAITLALARAGVDAERIGYVNAHGTGTPASDLAESAALHRALGPAAERIPVSSSKSVHGHTLEAAGLLELIVTVLATSTGRLPVNAGDYLADPACPLAVVDTPTPASPGWALSLNAAFGGANTALVVAS
ncbi:beta-ketoacyl-[acyl-carrier-protein] synthase family protein [Kitasatospora sp. NBC_01560]|uniref:beta-ketoacyl synthase N-terminal-like domain-containing protein n=1 Tax=Kitasatospora sp. NBC_01560 TaxID=2975965 RepID=UPI00386AF15A